MNLPAYTDAADVVHKILLGIAYAMIQACFLVISARELISVLGKNWQYIYSGSPAIGHRYQH